MEDTSKTNSLGGYLKTTHSVLIVLPEVPSYDGVAGSLGLFLSLEKMGKQVSIVSPQAMTVEFSSLVGVDRIKTKPEGRNLIISFDYLEDSIEKVSYNIDRGKFNLVIQPKEEFPPLSAEKVQYSYGGAKPELILTVGVNSPSDLGKFYKDNQTIFENSKVFDLDSEGAASFSDKMVRLIQSLGLLLDSDIANNLLQGIENATNGLSSPLADADTFEAVAVCLRSGAQRMVKKFLIKEKKQRLISETAVVETPPSVAPQEESNGDEQESPSPDWLGPKIYRGNTHT